MSEECVEALDSIYKEIPKSAWILIRNTGKDRDLEVVLEVNRKEKVIFKMKPSYIDDGIHSNAHNITWLLNRETPKDPSGL